MSSSYEREIYDIAVKTFETTCYMFPLEDWEINESTQSVLPKSGLCSVVGFHGAAKGKMVINPTDSLLSAMAENMLGLEDPNEEQKTGALCEIANIICGNTVPLFAHDNNICYIEPPEIAEANEDFRGEDDDFKKEKIEVQLDEGLVGITVFYSIEG